MTREPHLATQMRQTGLARLAPAAGNRGFDEHASTAQGAAHRDPDRLVPEDERRVEGCVADPAIHEPVPIRSAQADRRYPDERIVGAGIGHRFVVEPQPAIRVEAEGEHAV
jgi:hypothetical protein